MRSGCTTSRCKLNSSHSAADPVALSRLFSAGHSACQAPAARSNSCATGGVQQRGHQSRRLHRRGAGADRGDRVALVRHRRRATGTFGALGHLADVALGQQHDVEGNLADGRRGESPRPGDAPPSWTAGCAAAVGADGNADAACATRSATAMRRRTTRRRPPARRGRPAARRGPAIRRRPRRARRPTARHRHERRRHGVLAEGASDHRCRPP